MVGVEHEDVHPADVPEGAEHLQQQRLTGSPTLELEVALGAPPTCPTGAPSPTRSRSTWGGAQQQGRDPHPRDRLRPRTERHYNTQAMPKHQCNSQTTPTVL